MRLPLSVQKSYFYPTAEHVRGGCVLDLEQYRLWGRTPGAPILGRTGDTDVSLFTMSKSRPTGRSNPCAHGLDDRVVGGAYRDRTDDLLNANQALSQLS